MRGFLRSARGHPWAELERFIEPRVVGGVRLPVLGLAGLLLTKESSRDRDRADAAVLRAAIEAIERDRPG